MGPVSKVGTLVVQEALGHEADVGRLVDGDGHPNERRRRNASPTDACPEGSEVRWGTQTDCSSASATSRMPSRMLAAKHWSG